MNHLTPDALAAWMDGTLSAAERSAAEVHAADCAHCQAMLAAMARTAPPPPARAWWSAPAVRWLVPVTTAMLAIATWVGVTRERHSPVPRSASDVSAATESAPSASPAPPEPAAPQVSVADRVTVPRAKPESAKMATRDGKDQERRERMQSPEAPAPLGGLRQRADAQAGAAALSAPPPPAPASPAAPPPQSAASQAVPPAANAAAAAPAVQPPPAPVPLLPLQETVTVKDETALAKREAALDKLTARGAAARMRPVEVISPERTYRWRSLTPGSIQYSMDGGTSWRPSSTGTAAVLHAGSAPSRTVCWLVGQAGTVLLTIDGQNWQVRPFPERVDLTDVRATDARNATVTDSNLRRFATSDGGATWSPLQEN